MADTPNYNWPPMDTRKVIGTRPKRLDGPMKSSGRAKYSSDLNLKDMLHGVYLTCPHAHARVKSIDTSAAEKADGVQSVYVIAPAGTELQWQSAEIAAVAALTEDQARDAVRLIRVEYEVLPHNVLDADLARIAAPYAQKAGERMQGDPDKAFTEAEVVSEGKYGIPVVTHCCLEPHGQVIQWQGNGDGSQIQVWPSTQDVTDYAGDLGQSLKVPVNNIKVKMEYIGGGFGSKFGPDAWAITGANLSQKAGGRPVKLWLDRATEQIMAGNRPSLFAKVKVAGKKDGTITGWQGETWGSGGVTGLTMPNNVPYVFDIPNSRRNHTQVKVNGGPSRAWRAPGNQQASYITCAAIEDFAAKAGLDPVEVFAKNLGYAPKARQDTYRFQLAKAAELAEWKTLWHPRGQSGPGPIKRGLGLAIGTWQGAGHASQCRTIINPDGGVRVEIDTQDLGTGTRTVIVQVVAETLGVPMSQIKLLIGSNDLPRDGSSGGSTTVGGVSTSSRRSSVNALAKLFDVVAPDLGVEPGQLEATEGQIRVKGTPGKSLTWAAACRKLGTASISEMGIFTARGDAAGMTTGGVCGVQIADVSVDVETGVVKMNRYTAVHDCGLIINPRLAESVVYGAVIGGIGTALYEERILDQQTGKMLNPDMEFYKIAGIADVGDIRVHLDIREENDKRGVVGLGEPPAIPICGAIGNAVANAIGVRVPCMPMTPDRVLNALEGRA
jgi:xanthine dehydrogenase YagR molybdenum-binding subunit